MTKLITKIRRQRLFSVEIGVNNQIGIPGKFKAFLICESHNVTILGSYENTELFRICEDLWALRSYNVARILEIP